MKKIAKFNKVNFEQFLSDWIDVFNLKPEIHETEMIQNIYDSLCLPSRATIGSAGYDFKCPCDLQLSPGETIKIPTGIRCEINDGWVLKLYPRSSLGFKYRMQLDNTVGIIDSDYFYSDNEGHIFVKITNNSKNGQTLKINSGDGFIQGIFLPYGVTIDDNAKDIRNGGVGSTGV